MKHLLRELKKQEEKLFNCVQCGFCLPACPTYSRLGDEADSPRGRIHFMRAVVEGRIEPGSEALNRHLDRCLGCRACESVCPSGVEYGRLLEGAREVTAGAKPPRFLTRLLPWVMAKPSLLLPGMFLARALRATGFPRVAARRTAEEGFLGQLGLGLGMIAATAPPRLLDGRSGGAAQGEMPDPGELMGQGLRAGLLTGCVQAGLLGRVNQATVRVLEANGFEVVDIGGQGCCGALHAHTGDLERARDLARKNIEAFESSGLDLIAVNAAGCGAAMKDYPHLLVDDPDQAERAEDFGGRVRDVSELLGGRGSQDPPGGPGRPGRPGSRGIPGLRRGGSVRLRVTYDAPCHLLHGQQISDEPLALLRSIPELELIPLPGHEECCGGAGIYGITHPDLGGRISRDKVRSILETGAQVVATGNPGCMMQIGAGLEAEGAAVDVVHPIELLDESYRRGGLYS
ncbi:MAG: 4Fe-4S dicluster domain-containing protein [Gemmatimonadetes bacterium]|nr:4Fe-4S dicluster domain-containing protein [Gemmatimonadota bacterium]